MKQDIITNLSSLQGAENQVYRQNLYNSYEKIKQSLNLLKDLESIESSTNIAKNE